MGDVRWTLKEAAQQWGVTVKRIYKWIHGRTGSKGGGRRDSKGSRRRLFEGRDYEAEATPRGKVFYIINSAYPEPALAKINRPEGITPRPKEEAQPRPEISPESIVAEAQALRERAKAAKAPAAPKAPRAAPPPSPPPQEQTAAPTLEKRAGGMAIRKGGKKAAVEQPVAPTPPPPAPKPPPPPRPQKAAPGAADPATIFAHGRWAFDKALEKFSAAQGFKRGELKDKKFVRLVDDYARKQGRAAKEIAEDMFDRVLQLEAPEWGDSPTLPAIRDAFWMIFQQAGGSDYEPYSEEDVASESIYEETVREGGGMDGLGAFPAPTFAQRAQEFTLF